MRAALFPVVAGALAECMTCRPTASPTSPPIERGSAEDQLWRLAAVAFNAVVAAGLPAVNIAYVNHQSPPENTWEVRCWYILARILHTSFCYSPLPHSTGYAAITSSVIDVQTISNPLLVVCNPQHSWCGHEHAYSPNTPTPRPARAQVLAGAFEGFMAIYLAPSYEWDDGGRRTSDEGEGAAARDPASISSQPAEASSSGSGSGAAGTEEQEGRQRRAASRLGRGRSPTPSGEGGGAGSGGLRDWHMLVRVRAASVHEGPPCAAHFSGSFVLVLLFSSTLEHTLRAGAVALRACT